MADSSAEPMGTIRITIKTMTPSEHNLEVSPLCTVASLKSNHIAPLVNAGAERQRLIFRGRALSNDAQTLQAAGGCKDHYDEWALGQLNLMAALDSSTMHMLFGCLFRCWRRGHVALRGPPS